MAFVWDSTYAVNLIFCIIIVILSLWGYKKTVNKVTLYIGTAFILWGISHLGILLGYEMMLKDMLTVIRTIAYLIFIYAMYKIAVKK